MSRNWRMLTLAAMLALASTAPAQPVTWRPTQPAETTSSTDSYPPCSKTIWDGLDETAAGAASCEEMRITHGKQAAARMLMPELMAEFLEAFNDGNLARAELIADFACKLQPDSKEAQRARWLLSIAKQTQLPADGA